MKAGVLRSRSPHEPGAAEHCPAEKLRTRWRCGMHILQQKDVTVVGSIHLDSRLDEYQTSAAQF